jgi:hypothetical protein
MQNDKKNTSRNSVWAQSNLVHSHLCIHIIMLKNETLRTLRAFQINIKLSLGRWRPLRTPGQITASTKVKTVQQHPTLLRYVSWVCFFPRHLSAHSSTLSFLCSSVTETEQVYTWLPDCGRPAERSLSSFVTLHLICVYWRLGWTNACIFMMSDNVRC